MRGQLSRGIDMGCPQCNKDDSPYVGINAGPLLSSLPSLDEFYDPGLVFRWEEEDKDDDGNNLQKRDEGKGTMTMTTTTVAMGGAMSKDDDTGTLSRAVATAMEPPNVSLAPCCCATRKRLGSLEIYSSELSFYSL